MLPLQLDCIFFDLDNTLLDHDTAEHLGFNDTFIAHSLCTPNQLPELFSIYKVINDALWQQLREGKTTAHQIRTERFYQLLLQCFDFGKAYSTQLAEDLGEYYLESYERHWQLFPYATEVLQHAKQTVGKVGIITNGFTQQAKRKFRRFNFSGLVDSMIVSSEVGIAKPDKQIFDIALESVSVPNSKNAMFVGDHYDVDILGAKNAGWQTVWFSPTHQHQTTLEADYTINSLHQLIELL